MEIKNPATIIPPEIWTKIFELLNTPQPDYSKNLYTNDILSCYRVCVAFRNILKSTIISSLLPQALPFIYPYISNNSIKSILNCRLVCKTWKQGVDHFLESHHIFTQKKIQDGQVHTNYLLTLSSPNISIPMTCLPTKQDIITFLRETSNRNGSPFVGNSLQLCYSVTDDHIGSNIITLSSVQELLIKFGRFVKVLSFFKLHYQYSCPYQTFYHNFYDQIKSILEYTPHIRRLSIQGSLNTIPGRGIIEIEHLNEMLDVEVDQLNLPDLESVEIDIGGEHCLSLRLAIHLGISSSLFLNLKWLSLSNNLTSNFYPQSKSDQEKWLNASLCLPNLEKFEVRILAISNLFEVCHLASNSTKLSCLTIIIATYSWKNDAKYFSKYCFASTSKPYYRSLLPHEHEREYYYFLTYRLDLGDLLRTVQNLFYKSLETLVIFVEEVARKHCKANQQDLEILREMPYIRNLHIEGFPLCKFEMIERLPSTLNSLVMSGFLGAFHFDDVNETNKLKMMPGVSSDLKDGWTIYQSKLWELLPNLQWLSVILWDHKKYEYTVYTYRREKRDWLITRNGEQAEQENFLAEKTTCRGNDFCCSIA